jgi:Sec-independent protein translocase protein TatA
MVNISFLQIVVLLILTVFLFGDFNKLLSNIAALKDFFKK